MPGFQDFGEVNLTGNGGHGYIRLDWFTPDALPTWGDGRLLILGDKGFIEIRKYTDLAKSEKGNHLFLANNDEVKHIDCSCLLYTSPSPRDGLLSRMPSSA